MSKHSNIKDLDRDALYFIPLGGSEQFGVNLNVYATGGELLAVDCGLGFADEHYPGIDLLLPDPTYLEDNREYLKALIITHAHEDHIGAVAYLWDRLGCPIYASPFAAAVLRQKLEEKPLRKVPIHVIKPMDVVDIGKFKVQFLPVSHSIPESMALVIETKPGRVVHSGDWNLDPKPVINKPTDAALFKSIGDKGVLAYIGDSTNAEVPGRAGSESDVEKGLAAEFKNHKGRIAVTIFSSNIGRIESISRAAQSCGRRVGILGRSLHRMIAAARETGYLKNIPDFVQEEDFDQIADGQLVVIVTGSQGEYRSALAKIARGDFQGFTLDKKDTVIFSARPIPGNDRDINTVKNNLSAAGIKIVTPSDTDNVIHVSGHPCRDEIAEMYSWLRPAIVVPVHGERTQLDAQAAFAKKCQVQTTIVPNNGSVIKLAPGKPEIIDHVHTDLLAVDQKRIIAADHQSIAARRKLQYTGAVHVTIVMNANGKLLASPKVDTVGLVDDEDPAEQQILDNLHDEVLDLIEEMNREELKDDHFVTEELRIGVRRFMVHILGLKPKTTVHVVRV
jgi:ribonuclease J